MSAPLVIQAAGLTKVFRDFWRRARVRAVNNLDLDVAPGEVFGLLGPNGSGKSTTIKMILGLLHPSRGRVSVFNRPPDDVKIKARIGYLPEESYLYRFLNARETLDYYGTLFKLPRRDRKRRTEELLEMVGLRSAARRPVGEYSKGMARRIGLAQALINDPDLLILDEPTSGLDPIGTKLVKDIIVRLGEVYQKTILLSSHLLADVEEVCSRVTILYGGQIQEQGRIDEILSRRNHVQMVTEQLTDETLAAIRQLVQQREGKSLDVSVPRDRLESLFLRIVERAQAAHVETSGSAAAGDIAGFLGAEQSGEAVLESLVRSAAPEPAPAEPQPTPQPEQPDASLLEDLTSSTPAALGDAAPEPTTPAAPPKPLKDVDRDVLDDLLGDEGRKEDG